MLLAEEGPRGLSHLKVDRLAGVPDGTTSFYYRTRSALLRGVADQLVRYDYEGIAEEANGHADDGAALLATLAALMMRVRVEPHLSRTRARLELVMLSRNDSDLAASFQAIFDEYAVLARRLVGEIHNDGGPIDPEVVAEQASVLLTYLSGLVYRFANGADEPVSAQQIERQIRSMLDGIASQRG